jgi:hypothetical protein
VGPEQELAGQEPEQQQVQPRQARCSCCKQQEPHSKLVREPGSKQEQGLRSSWSADRSTCRDDRCNVHAFGVRSTCRDHHRNDLRTGRHRNRQRNRRSDHERAVGYQCQP